MSPERFLEVRPPLGLRPVRVAALPLAVVAAEDEERTDCERCGTAAEGRLVERGRECVHEMEDDGGRKRNGDEKPRCSPPASRRANRPDGSRRDRTEEQGSDRDVEDEQSQKRIRGRGQPRRVPG
jgi:hypothetical protein